MKTVCVSGMCFELHEDHAELCSAEKGLERAVIPDEVEGLPVTVLRNCVFAWRKELQEIVLPKHLTRIDRQCFIGCDILEHVEFPKSLGYIDYEAFGYCISLKSIHVASRCRLGERAFFCCPYLMDVRFDDEVDIGYGTFEKCERLEYITGDRFIREIGDRAFKGCSSLRRLHTNADRVCEDALADCTALEYFTCSENCVLDTNSGLSLLTNLREVLGAGLDSDGFFVYTPDGRTVARYVRSIRGILELPDTVTQLCENAFRDSKLCRVVLPETITSLPPHCFENAVHLQEVIAPGVTKVAEGCFSGCISLETVVTKPLEVVPEAAFKDCHHLQEIRLSPECTVLHTSAFMNCYRLRSVEAEGVEQVGLGAFHNCINLREMPHMPKLRDIRCSAFCHCPKLTHLEFPETLQVIQLRAFADCVGLKSIHFRGDASGKVHETAFDENVKNALLPDHALFYTDDDLWQMDEDEYEEDVE